jgi:hypothetical protein
MERLAEGAEGRGERLGGVEEVEDEGNEKKEESVFEVFEFDLVFFLGIVGFFGLEIGREGYEKNNSHGEESEEEFYYVLKKLGGG